MKIPIITLSCLFIISLSACSPSIKRSAYETENLKIEKIGKQTYVHTSYLKTEDWGNVPCNGMIVVDHGEAIVFDTPINNEVSKELINWIKQELKAEIKAIVPTHFHEDCLGGLAAFHKAGIPSYSTNLTIELAKDKGETLPQNGFNEQMILAVGKETVECIFLGAGHSYDNIVAYFPKDQSLFGGCLIKSVGAGKGNLADAHVEAWPASVEKVKSAYPNAKVVVPGHGKHSDRQLLEYTIQLFKQ